MLRITNTAGFSYTHVHTHTHPNSVNLQNFPNTGCGKSGNSPLLGRWGGGGNKGMEEVLLQKHK